MKLTKNQMLLVSFTLFSLFFGAGNLIFPPLLGQQAGAKTFFALIGFLITAVVLPILGVIVVGRFNGLTNLAGKVGARFAIVFTLLIYLSIGPGLGIPRAGSVPFEMAIAPYLPEGANLSLFMILYTVVFFSAVIWLCFNPGKLVKRIGTFLTPTLLILIVVLFLAFLFKANTGVGAPTNNYENNSFLQGFVDGYQTMDTIAALNFGLVIVNILSGFGISDKKNITKTTILLGTFAGGILALVYTMLSVMGAYTSAVYPHDENGALILRRIVYDIFGGAGAVLLALIFTLACLTTCIGLTNSISQFFSTLFPKIKYRYWVIIITSASFLICNLGLNAILSISVPILNAIYPVSIVLIVLGLLDKYFSSNKLIYKLTIYATFVISIIYAMEDAGLNIGFISKAASYLPLYTLGFGWFPIAALMVAISIAYDLIIKKHSKKINN